MFTSVHNERFLPSTCWRGWSPSKASRKQLPCKKVNKCVFVATKSSSVRQGSIKESLQENSCKPHTCSLFVVSKPHTVSFLAFFSNVSATFRTQWKQVEFAHFSSKWHGSSLSRKHVLTVFDNQTDSLCKAQMTKIMCYIQNMCMT